MVDEIGSSGIQEEISQVGQGQEQREGPSEADISRVEQQTRKAKHISITIGKSKKQNSMIAQFLTLLLNKLESNDELLFWFHKVFFRTKDKNGNTLIRKNTNNMVMIGLFIPFFREEAISLGLDQFFAPLYPMHQPLHNINQYILYLKRLSYHHHDNKPLHREDLLKLIMHIIGHYDLVDEQALAPDKQDTLLQTLYHELFEQESPPPPPPLANHTHTLAS